MNVSVDATAPGAPLERVWPFYGYDELNYTGLPEGKALLASLVSAHSAPVRVRSHFLFNTGDGAPAMKWGSTNVYTEDASGSPVYDWSLTDEILDTIVEVGAHPFVELGFMPEALTTHPKPYRNSSTIVLNGGCFYPPSDFTKWAALVRTWAAHASSRYGNVAASWAWELWNEPDSGYWHGTFDEYAKLYDYTEAALHEAIPEAALGGPAVIAPNGPFLRQFLDHCATGTNSVTGATGTRLDLITFHAKGGVTVNGDQVQLNLGNQLRLHRAGFEAVAAFSQFARTPIYITEADPDGCAACPPDLLAGAEYRNSPAYGAYEMAMMKRTLELEAGASVRLAGVLTWAFMFPETPYFAGYRVLSTNGIDLPVLGAFKLLGRLQGARLSLVSAGARPLPDLLENSVRDEADIDGLAALDGKTIRVLLWNYHDDIVSAPPAPMHLEVMVPPGFGASARISHVRVDESHGNAYSVWAAQGKPESPSLEQIVALEQAMLPAAIGPDERVIVAPGGKLSMEFDLPRFGVSLVTIEPEA